MNTSNKHPSRPADDASQSAQDAIESTRAYAQNAVNAAGEKIRDLRRETEPAVEQLAARVQQAVQRGLDAASTTSARARRQGDSLPAEVSGRNGIFARLLASLRDIASAFRAGVVRGKASRSIGWIPSSDPRIADNEEMTGPTREEIDAKLQTAEERADARVQGLTLKLDGYMMKLEERDKRIDDRFTAVSSTLTEIKSDLKETRTAMGSMKTTFIVTAISSVIAIILGVAAFNATLLSNMASSYESGKSTATALVQATEQMKQTQEQMKALQESLVKERAPK